LIGLKLIKIAGGIDTFADRRNFLTTSKGMAAAEKAFKRMEEIFSNYPILGLGHSGLPRDQM